MKNPYEVLGVKQNASMDEVTKAYKEMAKKYHPDKFINNPLQDLAQEKMREANEAYDAIKNSRGGGYTGDANYSTGNSSSYTNGNQTNEIRMMIQRRQYDQAINTLNSINNHDAEWNYLMGIAHYQKGYYDMGMNYIHQAVTMNPNNNEYRSTYNQIMNQRNSYRGSYMNRNADPCGGNNSSNSTMDMCCKLWMLDTFCECFGCDLIRCL